MNKRFPIVILALLVLLAFVFFLMRGDPGGSQELVSENGRSEAKLTALTKGKALGSGVMRRSVSIERRKESEPPAFDPYESWTTERILRNFGIPPGEFEGASIVDVVAFFEEAYAEHGGRGISFRVEGAGGHPVTCEFGNVMADSLMNLMSGLAGYEAIIGDGEVVFRRRRLPLAATGMQSVSLDIDVGHRLMEGEKPEVDEVIVLEKLADYGIKFGDGAGVEIDAEGGRLWLNNVGEEVERALALYQFLMDDKKSGQVLVSSKLVALERAGIEFEDQTYSDADFQIQIRQLSQVSGADLISAPSVVTVGGQRAKVEVVREYIYPITGDGGEEQFDVRNAGFTMEITPLIAGLDRVQLDGLIDRTTLQGESMGDLSRIGQRRDDDELQVEEDSFRSYQAEFEGGVLDRDTAGFLVAEEDGAAMFQFITVRRISPDGRPLATEAERTPAAE